MPGGKLRAAFPLFMRKDFEVSVNQAHYEVGVDNIYPAALREMISAAIVTYQLQNKSIDNVRKNYLRDLHYEEDPGGASRMDRACKARCFAQINRIDAVLKAYPPLLLRPPTVGEWIGDLTLLRIQYSFERAFAEADKGALFESVAIARMILEQLAWTDAIRPHNDIEVVKSKSASKAIASLAKKIPDVGRLYGWMSNHVHWEYEAHSKVITSDGEYDGALYANSEFKAIAFAMLIALTLIITKVFNSFIASYSSLSETAEANGWYSHQKDFNPLMMIDEIRKLSDDAPDLLTLMKIVKVAEADG